MSVTTIILIIAVAALAATVIVMWQRSKLAELRAEMRVSQAERTPQPTVTLPVVRETEVLQPDAAKKCSTCVHFDLADGQAAMRAHGPFAVAAQFVPPYEMGAQATPEGEIIARDIPMKSAWEEYGHCGKRMEGIWGPTTAERRTTMQGDDGVEGTFLEDGVDCYEVRA